MPKRSSKPKKKPSDVNALAAAIVAQATSESDGTPTEPVEQDAAHLAAVALGRLGGLKGGKARARALTKKKRADIAKKAARARWAKKPNCVCPIPMGIDARIERLKRKVELRKAIIELIAGYGDLSHDDDRDVIAEVAMEVDSGIPKKQAQRPMPPTQPPAASSEAVAATKPTLALRAPRARDQSGAQFSDGGDASSARGRD